MLIIIDRQILYLEVYWGPITNYDVKMLVTFDLPVQSL